MPVSPSDVTRHGKNRNRFTGKRPRTPEPPDETEPTIAQKKAKHEHTQTPPKAAVQAVVLFNDTKVKEEDQYTRPELFRWLGVPQRNGERFIQGIGTDSPPAARQFGNNSQEKETRGRERLLADDVVFKLERMVWNHGFEGRTCTWELLAEEAQELSDHNKPISARTVQRAMNNLGWGHCVACRKSFVNEEHAKRRKKWAEDMLKKYPEPKDWYRVRFSDEVSLLNSCYFMIFHVIPSSNMFLGSFFLWSSRKALHSPQTWGEKLPGLYPGTRREEEEEEGKERRK